MRRAVEDEVAEAQLQVRRDALDGLVGVARADEARGGLLVVELVGQARELARDRRRPAWPRRAAPAAPRSGSRRPRRAVGRVGELDLDHALDRRGIARRPRRRPRRRSAAARSAYSSRGLPRGRDQAALGAGEARALGPAGGDPDGDRLRRAGRRSSAPPVRYHWPSKCTCSPVHSWRISADRLAQALEPLARAGPLDAGRRDLVHRLAGAEAEEDAPGSEAAERGERLRDDRRVVADTSGVSTLVPTRMREVCAASAPSHGSEAGECPPSCRNGWK